MAGGAKRGDAAEILLLGDIILDVPEPDHWLSGIAPRLQLADLTIAHLEVPHTHGGEEMVGDVPAPGADPAHLGALTRAGIRAVSLAGNHMADRGAQGIADTIATLDREGVAHAGAGMTLAQATAPAIIPLGDGREVALLSYNCVGPESAWAARDRAGTAYVAVRAADGGPARPQADLVEAEPASLAAMAGAIAAARAEDRLVVVALHKGITHRPATLAPYEQPVARAAIDAGADLVVGHHAHIARGIEMWRGKPIFHGLGNGCVVTKALSPGQDHPARAEWVERRKALFGFEPDPAYTLAPFHPEAVNAMIGVVRWHRDGRVDTGFVPVWIAPPGRPTLAEGDRATEVADYIDRIGTRVGLPSLSRRPQGDWVAIA